MSWISWMPSTGHRGHGPRLPAAVCALLSGLALALPAFGQGLGPQPVRIIVPYSAGGIVDLMARAVSDKLAEKLGVPVIVESKPGANTALGADIVARAKPDGHTLLMTTSAFVVTPHLQKVSWDPIADFVGVAHMGYAISVVAVHPSVPAKDIKSFIEFAKSKPGQINYLAPGTSSTFTLGAVLLELANDIKMAPVPYMGVPAGVADLLAGRIQFGIIPAPLALGFIAEGRLKGIAVVGSARFRKLPQIPTMTEQGYASSQVSSWYAFATSVKTPKSTLDVLNAALNEVLKDPAVIARVEEIGGSVASGWTVEQTTKLFADDTKRWGELIKKAGIKAE